MGLDDTKRYVTLVRLGMDIFDLFRSTEAGNNKGYEHKLC